MKFLNALTAAAVLGVLASEALAAGDGRSFQVKNRLRVEYDDNIYESGTDEQDSIKIIEEIEFLVNLALDQTFIGLRYRPAFVWWGDREPDDTDVHHDLDLIFTHNFSSRLSLSLKNTLRIAEQPEQIDRGTAVREQDDYVYNVVDGQLSGLLAPGTRLEAGGRYTTLRYDRSDAEAERENYDIAAGGVNLRRELSQSSTIAGELRYEETAYDGPDRGSVSEYAGALLEHVFSPSLLGSARGGAQLKEFNDDAIDSETSPYLDGSLTFLPSPATRLTAGAGYSMYESAVFPYASQDRTLLYVSLAHDVTARLSLYVAGSYQMGDYQADQSIDAANADGTPVEDGEEVVTQFSARASWKVNRSNWLEVGWQHLNLESDLRDEYDRNRAQIGWRTQI